MPKVYIIILNYNNWRDTIECLESVYKLDYKHCQVVVVDNCSSDDSLKHIKLWAAGERVEEHALKTTISSGFAHEAKPEPLLVQEFGEHECRSATEDSNASLVLIQAAANRGFAAGNNLGLRYALNQDDFAYAWLLNNDTVTEPDALSHLVEAYEAMRKAHAKVGLMGCKILYYDQPSMLQCAGGAVYNPWTGFIKQIGNGKPDLREAYDAKVPLDYVSGASMFFDRQFLQEVGLMEEKYFLYFEEFDWAKRSIMAGFSLAYVPEARIYHKEGGTISKKEGKATEKSRLADFYFLRSKLLFTQQFYPQCLPTVYLSILYTLLNRIRRGQTDRIKMLLKLALNPQMEYQETLK